MTFAIGTVRERKFPGLLLTSCSSTFFHSHSVCAVTCSPSLAVLPYFPAVSSTSSLVLLICPQVYKVMSQWERAREYFRRSLTLKRRVSR
eukprot:761551-Hanusia_phi.AAC.2